MSTGLQIYHEAAAKLASLGTEPAFWLICLSVGVIFLIRAAIQRPRPEHQAPKFVSSGNGFCAAWEFFSRRWDFYQQSRKQNPSRNFSFWIGRYPVVALSGEAARKTFYEHKAFSANEGYSILFGIMPSSKVTSKDGEDISGSAAHESLLNKTVAKILQREKMRSYLPALIDQLRQNYAELAERPEKTFDPFEDIYRITFATSVLILGCAEVARDRKKLEKVFRSFDTFKMSFDPMMIVFPWLPTPAMFRKVVQGARLWWVLTNTIKERQKTGNRENDVCQIMLDQGDSIGNIFGFLMTLLFAGHQQLAANSTWVLIFLASNQEWNAKARREVLEVANRHFPDPSMSLQEKLAALPLEAWEQEFPILELCYRDSIRLNTTFTCFRRNMSTSPIPLGVESKETVPSGWFSTYHISDVHLDPKLYPDPERWDPSRYLDGRAEHKAQQFTWLGFGAGRKACVGMKLARIKQNLISAFFLASFDFDLCGKDGRTVHEQPPRDFNSITHSKPLEEVFIRYKPAQSMQTFE